MNTLKSILFALFAFPVFLRAMEVDRSEYYSSPERIDESVERSCWNALDAQVHHEYCSLFITSRFWRTVFGDLMKPDNLPLPYEFMGRKKIVFKSGKAFNTGRIISRVLTSSNGKYAALIHEEGGAGKSATLIKLQGNQNKISLPSNFSEGADDYVLTDRYFIAIGKRRSMYPQQGAVSQQAYPICLLDLENFQTVATHMVIGSAQGWWNTQKSFYSLVPFKEISFAWLNEDGKKTHVFYYDVDKGEPAELFSLDEAGFDNVAISKDGSRVALMALPIHGEKMIAVFDKNMVNGKTIWQKVCEFIVKDIDMGVYLSRRELRFDPLGSKNLIFECNNKAYVYNLTRGINVNRYLLRSPKLLLSGKDTRKYDDDSCKIINGQAESRKIRVIDILRRSILGLISHFYPKVTLLGKKDSDLFEKGFPESVKATLRKYVVLNADILDPLVWRSSKQHWGENEEEPIAKRICLGKENNEKNNDKQEEPVTDEEAEFDKFVQGAPFYIDEE